MSQAVLSYAESLGLGAFCPDHFDECPVALVVWTDEYAWWMDDEGRPYPGDTAECVECGTISTLPSQKDVETFEQEQDHSA